VVDPNSLAGIPGNVSPRLAAAKDLGLAPTGQAIQRMSLRFNLTAAQQASLTQLLTNLQNPSSPQYHQWLTPEQFGVQFGLAPADLAQVSQWLTAQGFTITSVARGGEFIEFSGTVGQANQAFHTQLHSVQVGTETHIATYTAPMLPKAIANVTAAVTGLTDFKMKPHVKTRIIPGSAVSSTGVQPEYTSSVSGNTYVAPGDFYTIYDENNALTSGVNGTGVKIAVVGQTDVYSTDISTFRSVSGLPANAYTVVLDGTDPGYSNNSDDIVESELDLEWSGTTAPSATILFVNSTDVIDGSLTYAVDQNLAPIITDSYGDCEPDVGQANLVYYENTLQMAAAEGITVIAAAGDAGATDCDAGIATDGVSIDFPGDSPYVTAVGGTEFNEGGGTYWAATNGAYQGSALSYIPEMAWNDSVESLSQANGLAAGGGGASAYYSKPSWQVGTGVPADFSRDTPDVAFNASPFHDPYIMCIQGYCVNGYRASNLDLFVVGGTSVGAPSFAGILALVEQKTGSRIGVANPYIYALANSLYASSVFHDTTVGNNASPCSPGTTDCFDYAPLSADYSSLPCVSTTTNCTGNLLLAYSTTTGYDQATGWGSVDVFNMINDWALVTALPTTGGQTPSYTSLSGSAASAVQGTSVTFTATAISCVVAIPTPCTGYSSSTTPTGSVQFTVDGVAVGSAVTLSSGVATYSLSTAAPLTTGAHTVQATYLGDTNYAGSKGAFTLNVTSATQPDFTLSPATTTVMVTHGQAAPGVVFTVAALNGFTGSVAFQASASSTLSNEAEASFTVNPVTLTATTTSAQTTLNLFAYYPAVGISPGPGQNGISVKAANELRRGTIALEAGLSLAGVLLLVLLPKRRKFAGLVIAVLAVATVAISGCSSGAVSNTGATTLPTPPGTYTVTVSATGTVNSAQVTHTSTVTFVVQ
jgi:subtilase family serine protease